MVLGLSGYDALHRCRRPPERARAFRRSIQHGKVTAHRAALHTGGTWAELRAVGKDGALQWVPIEARVQDNGDVWIGWGAPLSYHVVVSLEPIGSSSLSVTRISLPLPAQSTADAARIAELTSLLTAELSVLKALLEGDAAQMDFSSEREAIARYHLLLGALLPPPPAGLPLLPARWTRS